MEELHRQIYIKSTSGVVKGFQRQGSLRSSARGDQMAVVKATVPQQATETDLCKSKNIINKIACLFMACLPGIFLQLIKTTKVCYSQIEMW